MEDWKILWQQHEHNISVIANEWTLLVFVQFVCKNSSDEASKGKKQLHAVGCSYTLTFTYICV